MILIGAGVIGVELVSFRAVFGFVKRYFYLPWFAILYCETHLKTLEGNAGLDRPSEICSLCDLITCERTWTLKFQTFNFQTLFISFLLNFG